MALLKLERVLEEALIDGRKLIFPYFIRNARLSIGLMQASAAEHLGIMQMRLSRLECGRFVKITEYELMALSTFYDIKISLLEKKYNEFKILNKKIGNNFPLCKVPASKR